MSVDKKRRRRRKKEKRKKEAAAIHSLWWALRCWAMLRNKNQIATVSLHYCWRQVKKKRERKKRERTKSLRWIFTVEALHSLLRWRPRGKQQQQQQQQQQRRQHQKQQIVAAVSPALVLKAKVCEWTLTRKQMVAWWTAGRRGQKSNVVPRQEDRLGLVLVSLHCPPHLQDSGRFDFSQRTP